MSTDIRQLLEDVRADKVSIDEALLTLKKEPFTDIGLAKLDRHRKLRQGAAEIIYGAGKTPEQIATIARTMLADGEETILITRLDAPAASKLQELLSFTYYEQARCGLIGAIPEANGLGSIVIATGGTSDIPVAEEAALTAAVLGNQVVRLYDVGVAGLHRTLAYLDEIMSASVLIAIAGMEGALASVLGGLVSCPVIAVPTSVGYGANFNGLAPLLAMLNSCASGIGVVNIDNGFGAAYLASRINHMGL